MGVMSDQETIVDKMMGTGLRLISRAATAPVVERLGLEDQTRQLIYSGAKRAFETATRASKRFKSARPAARKPRRLFDLRLTDEQQLMRDTLRRFAQDSIRPHADKDDESCAPHQGFLEAVGELGAASLAIDTSLGGAGEGQITVSNVLVAEDLAWGDLGLAVAALSPLSVVSALSRWGTQDQCAKYLKPYIDGDLPLASFALLESGPVFDPHRLQMTAKRRGDNWVLSGRKSLVPLAEMTDTLVVAARTQKGPRLFLVDRHCPGVQTKRCHAMGLRSAALGDIVFKDVKVPQSAIVGGADAVGEAGAKAYRQMVDRANVAWAALAVGGCQAVLDYVIPYANERHAFGEPISHRQAVAFMIADIAIELESMRMLTYRAAARLDAGLDCQREAYLARVLASEKAMKIGTDGVQLLGGAGFVKDHPVERWYRHLRAIGAMHGGVLV